MGGRLCIVNGEWKWMAIRLISNRIYICTRRTDCHVGPEGLLAMTDTAEVSFQAVILPIFQIGRISFAAGETGNPQDSRLGARNPSPSCLSFLSENSIM